MESYCVMCKKYTENINLRVSDTINGVTMILSNCAKCSSKKENQRSRTPLSKVSLLGDILF